MFAPDICPFLKGLLETIFREKSVFSGDARGGIGGLMFTLVGEASLEKMVSPEQLWSFMLMQGGHHWTFLKYGLHICNCPKDKLFVLGVLGVTFIGFK